MGRSAPLKVWGRGCWGTEGGHMQRSWGRNSLHSSEQKRADSCGCNMMSRSGQAERIIRDAGSGCITGSFGLRDAAWIFYSYWARRIYLGAAFTELLTSLCDKSCPLHHFLFLVLWLFYINMYKSQLHSVIQYSLPNKGPIRTVFDARPCDAGNVSGL